MAVVPLYFQNMNSTILLFLVFGLLLALDDEDYNKKHPKI